MSESESQEPGILLKQAREKKQLSIAQAGGALHLSGDIITQLEQNQFDNIAAPTYTRGYLRSYSKFLGLDAEHIVQLFNQHLGTEDTPEIIPEVSQKPQISSSDKPVKITTYLISFVLMVLLLVWWQSQYRQQEPAVAEEQTAEATNVLKEAEGVAPAFTYDFPVVQHPPGPFLNNDTENAVPYEPEPVNDNFADEILGDNIVINTGGDGSIGDLTLNIQEESWVEVYNALDKRLFHRLAQPGSAIKIKGLIPLSVLLGNATGVEVIFNGEEIDTEPFTRANVARLSLGE